MLFVFVFAVPNYYLHNNVMPLSSNYGPHQTWWISSWKLEQYRSCDHKPLCWRYSWCSCKNNNCPPGPYKNQLSNRVTRTECGICRFHPVLSELFSGTSRIRQKGLIYFWKRHCVRTDFLPYGGEIQPPWPGLYPMLPYNLQHTNSGRRFCMWMLQGEF